MVDSMDYDGFTYMFEPASMTCWLIKPDESHPVTQLQYARATHNEWTYVVEGTTAIVVESDYKVIGFLEGLFQRFIGDLIVKGNKTPRSDC